MREDERMREFIGRVVEMSPEPADFLEEPTRPALPQRSGAWLVAVAGLAAAVLMAPLVFMQGRPDPAQPGGPGTTVATSVPDGPVTTVAPPPSVSVGWPIFLVQQSMDSPTGNPALVAFDLKLLPGSDTSVLESIRAPEDVLFGLDDLPVSLPAGFTSMVPNGVRILERTYGTTGAGLTRVTLDMNREFLAGAGGLLADVTMLNQIIFTTLQFEVHEVLFTVEGEPVEAYGMEGISLLEPVDLQAFIDELNPIVITEPVYVDADGILTVRGWANVFEAALSWEIHVGSAALPAHSGFVTATCGTGCWGSFEILEDLSEREGDWGSHRLRVYSSSALDGSPTMVVEVPFSAIAELDRR